MLIDGIQLTNTSQVQGLNLELLTNFPANPVKGSTFFLTSAVGDFDPGQYTYGGTEWSAGSGGNPYSDSKESVRVASTDPVALPLNGLKTIDGISLADKDRVLLKNQADAKTNGIWQVVASGNWVRAKDASSSKGVTAGMYTFVTEGAANSGTGWVLNTPDPISLGISELSFGQFSGTGNISAGTGLQRIGNSFALIPTGIVPAIYKAVSVDLYGRIIAGSNPNTLAGFGITDAQASITGAASSVTANNLLASRVVTSDASGKITQHAVTVNDLTTMKANSDSQALALAGKQATITGAASSVVSANLTPNVLVGTDSGGKLVASSANTADIDKLAGVTSNIQTQLNAKLGIAGGAITGPITTSVLPSAATHLTNKQYVDQVVSSLSAQPRSIFATIPGSIVAFNGTLRWYPPFPITVSACRIFQALAPAITPTIVDVLKNGTTSVFPTKPTLNTGQNASTLVSSSIALTIDDYLIISVLQGSGEDLSIRIDYTS